MKIYWDNSGKIRFAALAILATFYIFACGDDPSQHNDNGSDSPEPVVEVTPLTSDCAIPTDPAIPAASTVVGDGTAASCTEDLLRTTFAAGGHITFDCGSEAVEISVTQELLVEQDAYIDGAGLVTLDGNNQTRIIRVAQETHLALRGLHFMNGNAINAEAPASGGAVAGGWQGSLDIRECTFIANVAGENGEEGGGAVYTPSRTMMTIVDCEFQNNTGGTGGAVHNLLSGLTVVNSVFVNNESVTDGGGGIYTDGASGKSEDNPGGTITLCGCKFMDNTARKQGGGAYLFAYPPDVMFVHQCEFTNNSVLTIDGSGALGGGLRTGNTPLGLSASLFNGNHSDRHGGALWVDGENTTSVENCTMVGNDAGVEGVSEGGYGGAISGGALVMRNLTIADNYAVNNGGAIFSEDETSELYNSIIANNTAGNEWGIKQSCRYQIQGSRNIQWPNPGDDTLCTPDILSEDPLLESLADNGGPTQTMSVSNESPAIDLGSDCPTTDQRDEPRLATCVAGAVESRN